MKDYDVAIRVHYLHAPTDPVVNRLADHARPLGFQLRIRGVDILHSERDPAASQSVRYLDAAVQRECHVATVELSPLRFLAVNLLPQAKCFPVESGRPRQVGHSKYHEISATDFHR